MQYLVMQTLCLTPWCGTVTTLVGLVQRKRGQKIRQGVACPTPPDEFQSLLYVHPRPIAEERAYNEGTIRQA